MRRARIAARPNLVTTKQKPAPPKLKDPPKEDKPIESDAETIDRPTSLFEATALENEQAYAAPTLNVSAIFEAATGHHSPRKVAFCLNEKTDGETRLFSPLMSPRRSRLNSLSSLCELSVPIKKKFRKFTGEEELDTKAMKMSDLCSWNPKYEKKLERKVTEEALKREIIPKTEKTQPMAPQVTIGPDGKLILDEKSLIIRETEQTDMWGSVDEERLTRHTTSMSFRTRNWRKGTAWTEKETDLFYDLLRHTGPDFGLMHEFFPTRARNELKSKYNREEKYNWERLKKTLSMPAILNDSLSEQTEIVMNQIRAEELEKQSRKRKTPVNNEKSLSSYEKVDWDELNADLVAEAEKIIFELESEAASYQIPSEPSTKPHSVSSQAIKLLEETEKLVIPIKDPMQPTNSAQLKGYEPKEQSPRNNAKKPEKISKETIKKLQESARKNPAFPRPPRAGSTFAMDISCKEEQPSTSAGLVVANEDITQLHQLPPPPSDPAIKRPIAIRPMVSRVPLPPISSMLAPLGPMVTPSTNEEIPSPISPLVKSTFNQQETTSTEPSVSESLATTIRILATEGPSAFSSPTINRNELPGPSSSKIKERFTSISRSRTMSCASIDSSQTDVTEDCMSMGNFDGLSVPKKAPPSRKITSSNRLWSSRFAIPVIKEIQPSSSIGEPVANESPILEAKQADHPEVNIVEKERPIAKRRRAPKVPIEKNTNNEASEMVKSPIASPAKHLSTSTPPIIQKIETLTQVVELPKTATRRRSRVIAKPQIPVVVEKVEASKTPISPKEKSQARVVTKAVGGIRLAVHPNASKKLEGATIRRPGQNKTPVAPVNVIPQKSPEVVVPREFEAPKSTLIIDNSDDDDDDDEEAEPEIKTKPAKSTLAPTRMSTRRRLK